MIEAQFELIYERKKRRGGCLAGLCNQARRRTGPGVEGEGSGSAVRTPDSSVRWVPPVPL